MRIDHIAIWTFNLEGLRRFYMHYFDAYSSEIYLNHSKNYHSYFLSFGGDCRLELMEMPGIPKSKNDPLKQFTGLVHFSVKAGDRMKVNEITHKLRDDGFQVLSQPHSTGDGFYESTVLDPDGNRIKIRA